MELKKMREMSEVELNAELENPIKMRDTKRDIARVKTIIREKQLEKARG